MSGESILLSKGEALSGYTDERKRLGMPMEVTLSTEFTKVHDRYSWKNTQRRVNVDIKKEEHCRWKERQIREANASAALSSP